MRHADDLQAVPRVGGFLRDEGGAMAVEYALVASVLVIAVGAGVLATATATGGLFTSVLALLAQAVAPLGG